MKLLVKTFTGLEQVLARELRDLGATDVQQVKRGVIAEGKPRLLYRANLELRTGLRVYSHLADVEGDRPEDLYASVGAIAWEDHLGTDGTLWVTSTAGHTPWVKNSMIVSLKTKDAIVDRLRSGDRRPNVDRERPDLRVHTYLHRGRGSVWLDSTGDPLFKRGYRLRTLEAPINEVLAAGILQLAGYTATTPLVDPMCGSGTFAIEAARMALRIPAQLDRQFFAFMRWPDYDAAQWRLVRQQAISRIHRGAIAPIIASDVERRAVRYADRNVREAGLSGRIELHEASFFDVSAPGDTGLVVMNPPYDERLPVRSGAHWYNEVGRALKHRWTGWEAWIVSGFEDGLKAVGLSPKQRIPLDNGGIPVELWQIPLFEGKREAHSEVLAPDDDPASVSGSEGAAPTTPDVDAAGPMDDDDEASAKTERVDPTETATDLAPAPSDRPAETGDVTEGDDEPGAPEADTTPQESHETARS